MSELLDTNQIVGRIHSKETGGTVDGPGIRYVVFLQGCPLRCKYCHNPDTWQANRGREVTVKALVEDIKKYKNFMSFTGGGVTVSGGEPLLQKNFVCALFKQLKAEGIHTALDTSGFSDKDDTIVELLENTDLVLLDIKHLDAESHKALTKVENKKILEFLKYLKELNKRTWIRYVVVPGYTDELSYTQRLADFVQDYPNVEKVEILPYHKMGRDKWKELNIEYELEGVEPPTKEKIQLIKNIFKDKGITTLCE